MLPGMHLEKIVQGHRGFLLKETRACTARDRLASRRP
jgi:hypothetical protein